MFAASFISNSVLFSGIILLSDAVLGALGVLLCVWEGDFSVRKGDLPTETEYV